MSGGGSSRRQAVLLGIGALALVAIVAGALILILGGSSGSDHPIVSSSSTAAPTTTSTSSTSTATGSSTTTTNRPGAEQIGASVNRLFNDQTYSPAQIEAQLAALAATGATLARSDALWEATEPRAPVSGIHHYDWGFDDSIAGSLAAQRLTWLPIIDYAPPWAESNGSVLHSAPRAVGDYAAFAAAFAARYGRGGSFWNAHPSLPAEPVQTYEIWNEPDNPSFWRPAPDAAAYADMYLRARTAIKAVDPAATVIVGGLTNPAKFVPDMVRARPDLVGHVDGIGIHPYGPTPAEVFGFVREARRILRFVELGSVPLYVTEVGWTTLPAHALDWAPAQDRGRYLLLTLATLGHVNCGIAMTIVYTWVTPERDPTDKEDWFGIHSPTGGASPDATAFATGLRDAQRPGTTLKLCAAA